MRDWQLLRQYVDEGSNRAFDEIVARYGKLVYSSCLREARDPELAQDIFQTVFVILACKARRLRRGTVLSGWLYQTARLASREAKRQEMRRVAREKKAAAMNEPQSPNEDAIWQKADPLVHDALDALSDFDRNLVLLRFYQEMSLREAGEELGLSENAARMRVSRSLAKMRRFLERHGAALSLATLATLLAERAVHADLPAGVTQAVAHQITAPMGAGTSSIPLTPIAKGVLTTMLHSQIRRASLAAGAVATVLGAGVIAAHMVFAQQSRVVHAGDIGSVALVRQYIAARTSGTLSASYGLLSSFSRSRIPEAEYGTWPPPREASLPPEAPLQLNIFVTDPRNVSRYKYQVLSAEASDPNTVDVLAIPPSGQSSTIKLVTVWDEEDNARRLDLFGSAALTYPPLAPKVNELKNAMQTMANEKALSIAIYQYAQASGHLPDADKWMDEITPYVKDANLFSDPSDPNQRPYGYAYNRALSGLPLNQVDNPPGTVLIFESTVGAKNATGLADTLPDPGPIDGRTGIAYVDGHVGIVADNARQQLNWQP